MHTHHTVEHGDTGAGVAAGLLLGLVVVIVLGLIALFVFFGPVRGGPVQPIPQPAPQQQQAPPREQQPPAIQVPGEIDINVRERQQQQRPAQPTAPTGGR